MPYNNSVENILQLLREKIKMGKKEKIHYNGKNFLRHYTFIFPILHTFVVPKNFIREKSVLKPEKHH
jgi:hypothetical protein